MNVQKETKNLVVTAMMLTVAIVFQFVGKAFPGINQFFVGPAVNAVILMTVMIAGMKWGIMAGAFTPVLALMAGILAAPMAPFVPFIALGNMLYATLFAWIRKTKGGEALGVLTGAFAKFVFLFVSASFFIDLFTLNIPDPVKKALGTAMGFNQFITALAGGAIAVLLVRVLVNRRVLKVQL